MNRNQAIKNLFAELTDQGETPTSTVKTLAERYDLTTTRIWQILGISAKEAKRGAKLSEKTVCPPISGQAQKADVAAYSETIVNDVDSDEFFTFVSPIKQTIPVTAKCVVGEKIKPLPIDDDLLEIDDSDWANWKPEVLDTDDRQQIYERFMSAAGTSEEESEPTTNDLLNKISDRIGKLENKVNAPFVHTPDRDVKVELNREVTTEIFLSDIHLHPEHSQGHDPAALALIEEVIKTIQPDIIYFGGDIGDYYAASRYDGVPILKTPEAYEGEIEYVRQRVGEIIANAPNARVFWDDEDGNHGRRMKKSVFANAPWLINRIKNVEADLDLERFDVKCVRDGFKVGKLAHWHGDDLPGAGAHIAKAKFMRELDNIIFGHHHNFSEHIQKKPDGGYYGAFGNGCLQWLSTDYAPRPNWQQGARVVQYSKSGNFHVDKILVHKPSVWSPHAETIYAGTHFKVDMSK
jgi:hypothetical protein